MVVSLFAYTSSPLRNKSTSNYGKMSTSYLSTMSEPTQARYVWISVYSMSVCDAGIMSFLPLVYLSHSRLGSCRHDASCAGMQCCCCPPSASRLVMAFYIWEDLFSLSPHTPWVTSLRSLPIVYLRFQRS